MIIRAFLLTIFACLPAMATASQLPADLSSDRADGMNTISINTNSISLGDGAVVKSPPSVEITDLFIENPSDTAARGLVALDPKLNLAVATRAIEAMYCALDRGMAVDKVVVVDMSVKAAQKRLWAFDIKNPAKPRLVINERVAHGSGSDPNGVGKAQKFSNTQNSNMTSLGLYKISERYQGKNGWSRRLDGLFARFNGKARDRAVVMHPSNYVSADRVGRSQGCPAVSHTTMEALEKAGLKNAVLWIDGPDKTLAQEVADCAKKRKAKEIAKITKAREEAYASQMKQRPVIAIAESADQTTSQREQEWGNQAEIGAVPDPEPLDQVLACELTLPRAPRLTAQNCLSPIDTLANGNRII